MATINMTPEQIIEICENHHSANITWARYYGLRVLNKSQESLDIDDELENSFNTADDSDYEELSGTSCVGFDFRDTESIEKAITVLGGYISGRVAVIAGYSMNYGQDDGEWVVSDASIVGFC